MIGGMQGHMNGDAAYHRCTQNCSQGRECDCDDLVKRLRFRGDATSEHAAEEIESLKQENFALQTKLFARGYQIEIDDLKQQNARLKEELNDCKNSLKIALEVSNNRQEKLQSLRQQQSEPVAWMYEGEPWFDGKEDHKTYAFTADRKLAEWKSGTIKKPVPLYLSQPAQSESRYLLGGTRYKVSRLNGSCGIFCLPEELTGEWVALVDATDNKHMNQAQSESEWLTGCPDCGMPPDQCECFDERMERDAARYRWLRDADYWPDEIHDWINNTNGSDQDVFDAAIDRAMQEGKKCNTA